MCMTSVRILLICVLTLFCFRTTGYADSDVEVVRKKGLFMLQGFEHWVNATYQFTDHTSNRPNSGRTAHGISETYNFNAYAAVVDPHMFRFSLGGAFGMQQLMQEGGSAASAYGSGSKYQYSFSGSGLEQSRFPFILQSSRTLDTVTPPFSATYTTDSTVNAAEFTLQHDIVPLKFRYQRDSTTLESGNSATDAVSNSFTLNGSHKIGDISSSSFSASLSGTESKRASGGDLKRNSGFLTLGFSNSIFFGSGKKHSLVHNLQWREDRDSEGFNNSNGSITGMLLSRYGKALDSQIGYQTTANRTTTFSGRKQDLYTNSFDATLHHHLYQSLDTRLRGQYTQATLLDGLESHYSGRISLSYRKRLPGAAKFTFDASGQHAVTDRNVALLDIVVRNELHTVGLQGDNITLNSEGILVSVNRVSGKISGITILYVEGIDYTVDTNLKSIQIMPGGAIADGTDIFVSYVVRNDLSIKYATDTLTLASSLALRGGKYNLNGTLTTQTQSLISGQPQNNLNNTRIGQIRFKGAYVPDHSYNFVFEDFLSSRSSYRYFEGAWLYKHRFQQSTFDLKARERYTINDATASASGNTQLTSSAAVSLSRPVGRFMQMSLMLDVTDMQDSKSGRTDLVFFRTNLFTRFNKLTASLNGQSSWRFYGRLTTRDDYVRLDFSRTF